MKPETSEELTKVINLVKAVEGAFPRLNNNWSRKTKNEHRRARRKAITVYLKLFTDAVTKTL